MYINVPISSASERNVWFWVDGNWVGFTNNGRGMDKAVKKNVDTWKFVLCVTTCHQENSICDSLIINEKY